MLTINNHRHLEQTKRYVARPLVGKVAAGFASPAEEFMRDTITIDEFLIEHPASTVLLRVDDDSMRDAGILDGDILVIERRGRASPGRIVAAYIDGEITIKELQRDAEGFYLRPANPDFPSIRRPRAELRIYGIMVGLFRKL